MLPIILVVAALLLAAIIGGIELLANPWFAMLAAATASAGLAAAFGRRSHGLVDEGNNWWEVWGQVAAHAALYSIVLSPPLLFPGVWQDTDSHKPGIQFLIDPKLWLLGAGLLLAVYAIVPGRRFPPGAVFPWAPFITVSAVLMRWGYWCLAQARAKPAFVFPGAVPSWVEGFWFFVALAIAAIIALFIILGLVAFRVMKEHGKWWWRVEPNSALLVMVRTGFRTAIADLSGIDPPQAPTPAAIANAARQTGNWQPVYRWQLLGPRPMDVGPADLPQEDTAGWEQFQWDDHWQDDVIPGRRRYLERLDNRLDPSVFCSPDLMCLPDGAYPGLPYFTKPFGLTEPGLEVERDEGALPRHYVDLRRSGPQYLWSETVVAEHGFELSLRVSYRLRPVWLPIMAACKARNVVVQDHVRNALNQVIEIVGPWLYGFVGDPVAEGGIQRGLGMANPARPATPFTRPTSMRGAVPTREDPVPALIAAKRPAFLQVRAVLITLVQRVLLETGLYLTDLQFDDVEVADERLKDAILQASAAVILSSVSHEVGQLQFVVVERKLAAVIWALDQAGVVGEDRTAILKEVAKLLPLNMGTTVSDLLVMAGRQAGVYVRPGGEKK